MKIVASAQTAALALATVLSTSLALLPGAPARAEKVYSGEVCTVQVHKLTNDIKWQTKLPAAEELAKNDGKLVFWMHMLGKIDGAT